MQDVGKGGETDIAEAGAVLHANFHANSPALAVQRVPGGIFQLSQSIAADCVCARQFITFGIEQQDVSCLKCGKDAS